MNGQCVECGLKGQSVCPDGTCRPGGVAVNGLSGVTAVNGTCVACGEKGQPPCAGSTCDPLAYLVPVNGACVPNPSVLGPSEMLVGGQSLVARDCAYHLDMQKDGNLVLYQGPGNSASSARWSLGTTYNAGAGAIMQSDGNFVLYDTGKVDLSQTDTMYVVWSTQTFGQYGAFATVQDDGNFVVYKGGTALWASNTAGSALGQTCALRAHTTHIETGYFALGPISSVKNGLSMVQCASTAPGCAAVLYDGITLGTGDCSCLSSVTGWEPSTALVSMWVESD
jgi:hypothetical protein